MIFIKTEIEGLFIIKAEKKYDERGFFARTFCINEFTLNNLNTQYVQCSVSFNKQKGTLRGMHYQVFPYEEEKIVTCIKGKIYDVVLDLRKDSKTFNKWFGIVLEENEHTSLYIPKGLAHGFLTLENNTEILYQISNYYNPEYSRGIRYDDPLFNIKWPREINIISEKDLSYEYIKR